MYIAHSWAHLLTKQSTQWRFVVRFFKVPGLPAFFFFIITHFFRLWVITSKKTYLLLFIIVPRAVTNVCTLILAAPDKQPPFHHCRSNQVDNFPICQSIRFSSKFEIHCTANQIVQQRYHCNFLNSFINSSQFKFYQWSRA